MYRDATLNTILNSWFFTLLVYAGEGYKEMIIRGLYYSSWGFSYNPKGSCSCSSSRCPAPVLVLEAPASDLFLEVYALALDLEVPDPDLVLEVYALALVLEVPDPDLVLEVTLQLES